VLEERISANHKVRRKPYSGGHASKALEARRFPKRLAPRRVLAPKRRLPFTVRVQARWSTKVFGAETAKWIKALPVAGIPKKVFKGQQISVHWPAPIACTTAAPPNPARAELGQLVLAYTGPITICPPEMTSARLNRCKANVGRPPIGKRPMTPRERKRRQRERNKLERLRLAPYKPLRPAPRPAPDRAVGAGHPIKETK